MFSRIRGLDTLTVRAEAVHTFSANIVALVSFTSWSQLSVETAKAAAGSGAGSGPKRTNGSRYQPASPR